MKKCYCIYILQSQLDNRYYVGATSDIERRLGEHNAGKVPSTKPFRPWVSKYLEKFDTLSLARKREKQIKNWKKRSAIERLING